MRSIVICLLVLWPLISKGQDSKGEMAVYNTALGSLFGGIGAIINKKPDQKAGHVFLKGMAQGAFGGYLVYESKNLIGKISERNDLKYSWPAKFVNAAGSSIIENAASNRNFYEEWHFNIGFNRFEIHTREKLQFKYKILPLSFLATGISMFTNDFEMKRSLQTGEFIFSNNKVGLSTDEAAGITYGNVIILNKAYLDDLRFYSHEIIHVYQYYDFNPINSFFNRDIKKWESGSKMFRWANNIFYWDFHAPVLLGLYLMEQDNENYYNNFFENEAGFWSNTIFDFPSDNPFD